MKKVILGLVAAFALGTMIWACSGGGDNNGGTNFTGNGNGSGFNGNFNSNSNINSNSNTNTNGNSNLSTLGQIGEKVETLNDWVCKTYTDKLILLCGENMTQKDRENSIRDCVSQFETTADSDLLNEVNDAMSCDELNAI